jgi:ParB family chromosome partitioning protein
MISTSGTVPIERIRIGNPEHDPGDVTDLVESIRELGLINPIQLDEQYNVVSGRRRLKACRLLGMREVPATIFSYDQTRAALAKIDENLIRKHLTRLELADLLARRQELYLALHPETRRGTAGGLGRQRKRATERRSLAEADDPRAPEGAGGRKSFSRDTADKLDRSTRFVEQHVRIGKNLAPEARTALEELGFEPNKDDLLDLVRLDPARQVAAVRAVRRCDKPASLSLAIAWARRQAERSGQPEVDAPAPAAAADPVVDPTPAVTGAEPHAGAPDEAAGPARRDGRADRDPAAPVGRFVEACRALGASAEALLPLVSGAGAAQGLLEAARSARAKLDEVVAALLATTA